MVILIVISITTYLFLSICIYAYIAIHMYIYICNSYNMGTSALPDMYARSQRLRAYISDKALVPML